MTFFDGAQIAFFIALVLCLSPLLGKYMAAVFQGKRTIVHSALGWLEGLTYKACKIDPQEEMNAWGYAKALFLLNLFGFLAVFFLQLFQRFLPLNPQNFAGVPWDLSLNTAVSFVTNTNWQSYSGETTLSYLTQMLGLAVQNFLSAATGLAVLLVLIRGIVRKTKDTIGNFWADLVRGVVYILLPLSIILAVVLVAEGAVQNFSPYVEITTLENDHQVIPLGPAASQIAIKQLGTNGGGFYGANSAHPFENPTGLSNFLEILAILLIPTALAHTYGYMVNSRKHGWVIFFVMMFLWGFGLVFSLYFEHLHNPVLGAYPVLEGKETRFGVASSIMWALSTTATANGSVNAMISSMSPIAGGLAMFNIMLGELIFGGVGVGLCSMIMFILLTVFLAGLMIGRTPEYLGKKIEKREIQWVMAAILMPGILVLIGAGISCVLPVGLSSISNQGPHGLSEILYAFTSCSGNNGSAFAGINANTPYYNITLAFVMITARCAIIIPSLAVGGLLVRKKITPSSAGTFSTNTLLFSILLIGVIFIVGALTFFPALTLGPIVEEILMLQGRSF